jgi:hypothetical protein
MSWEAKYGDGGAFPVWIHDSGLGLSEGGCPDMRSVTAPYGNKNIFADYLYPSLEIIGARLRTKEKFLTIKGWV